MMKYFIFGSLSAIFLQSSWNIQATGSPFEQVKFYLLGSTVVTTHNTQHTTTFRKHSVSVFL